MTVVAEPRIPRDDLAAWYLLALRERVTQVEALIERMEREGEREGGLALERIARSLRSTGTSFGFTRITAAAEVVELSASRTPVRLAEALCRVVRPVAWPDVPLEGSRHHWIARTVNPALRSAVLTAPDTARAWQIAAEGTGGDDRLASELAAHLGLEDPVARPAPGTLPPTLPRTGEGVVDSAPGEGWVCLRVEDEVVHVASACPVALETERLLEEGSGRRIRWWIIPPGDFAGLAADAGRGALQGSVRDDRTSREGGRGEREGRVLVVDDDADSRLLVRAVIERESREVEEFPDGRPVLRHLDAGVARDEVALLIVDLDMPGIGGLEVVREVRARGLEFPVLVLTGDGTPEREVELLESGATDFLRKPVSPPVLAARARALLRR